MILFHATPPPTNLVQFWERILPGFWDIWLRAADLALGEIDAGAGGDTVITSWWRSPLENRRVGGSPDSQHLVGLAFDVVPGKGSFQLAVNEASQRFTESGFVTVPESTHLHVQTFPAGLLRQAGVLEVLSL